MTNPAPWFTLAASPDGLGVQARFTSAPPSSPPPPTEILDALRARGVCHGILYDEIEAAMTLATAGSLVLVASGDPPVPGSPGRIERLLEPGGTVAPRVFMDGSVDFRQASRFTRVRKGTRLLRRVLPRPGIQGTDVQGRTIPVAAPAACDFPPASNLCADPDDPTFQIAAIDGILTKVGNALEILPELVIEGNVDLSTGNVDFPGHVSVQGNVQSGCSVKTLGGLDVGGTLERCSVAVGGDLVVQGGILGSPGTSVQAAGSMAARYAENARIVCGKDLLLERSAMNCQLTARGSIYVSGNLVSGSAVACKNIEAKNLGSPIGMPLHLCLGYTPEACDALDQILAERVELERRHWQVAEEAVRLGGQSFLKHRDLRRIPEGAREPARGILAEIAAIEKTLIGLYTRQKDLIRGERAEEPNAALTFSGELLADVWVNLGSFSTQFFDRIKGPLSLNSQTLKRVASCVAFWVSAALRQKIEEGLRPLGYRGFISAPGKGADEVPTWLSAAKVLFLEPAQAAPKQVEALSKWLQGVEPSALGVIAFATRDPLQDRSSFPGVRIDAWVDAPEGKPDPDWLAVPPLDTIL